MKIKNKQGITLIALIITIIILLILAGISINLIFGDNGLINRANEGKFKQKMSEIAEAWELKIGNYEIENRTDSEKINPSIENIYAGEILKSIIVDEDLEIEEDQVQDIKVLIPRVGKEEETYVIIHEGELYYVSQPTIKNNTKQVQWCQEIGIKIWEYIPQNSGIYVTNGGYEWVNGIYVCTPKINTGFVKEKTRYIKEKDGNLTPGNWINKKPDTDWYDYKNRKWANLYVESEGLESYYVWIPRYVYKEAGNERMDVKFVDINNNYKDGDTHEETKWEELQKQGYKIPEAFMWGDNENAGANEQISGYWINKYQLSEFATEDTYPVRFETAATMTTITIQDIAVKSKEGIAKYTYAVNGKIVHESTNGEEFKLTGLAKGNKAINVTILDEKDNILGSMTKLYEVADVNPPDLTGFDPDTTFYVYWDENGIEHNEIPIRDREREPAEWYDYTSRNWANIVTRNNGVETYLVWIPRYQYSVNNVSQRTTVKFIKGIDTTTDTGADTSYKIPEAFSWGDNNEIQLTGYWISKYQLSEAGAAKITTEMAGGDGKIQIKDITGTEVTKAEQSGTTLKYEYYINGKKIHEGTNPKENYKITGLEKNKIYTVNIIARNSKTNVYIGATTQKVETIGGNAPVFGRYNEETKQWEKGFNEDRTYYVLYDDKNNMTIGEKIKIDGSNMPEDWYDYGSRKWANIVVTDGKVENGKITGATNTTYLVWIPRYQYSLDTTKQRTNIKLIEGTSTNVEAGYKIPEAFSWGDSNQVQLPGYWITKYQLSN